MERRDIERWFATHPTEARTDVKRLLDRCEREVKRYTHHDAWERAHDIAEHRLHDFEEEFGLPASEAFVAREVCHAVARELRNKEPHLGPEDDARIVAEELLAGISPAAVEELRHWLHDLAECEEHEAWLEIVRFTDHCGKAIIEQAGLTERRSWDFDHSYTRNAAKVTRALLHEFEEHMRAEDERLRVGTEH